MFLYKILLCSVLTQLKVCPKLQKQASYYWFPLAPWKLVKLLLVLHPYEITDVIFHLTNMYEEGPSADCNVEVIAHLINDVIKYTVLP